MLLLKISELVTIGSCENMNQGSLATDNIIAFHNASQRKIKETRKYTVTKPEKFVYYRAVKHLK